MDRTAYERYFALEHHFWRTGRREIILDFVDRYRPPGQNLRILDVGGACSLISRELGRFGQVTVIEPDPQTADFAKRELGTDVRIGTLPYEIPVEGPFDIITLLDVIEHIDDDEAALLAIQKLLRPSGLVIITVPALRWLWSNHDVANHHRRRYVRDSLKSLIDRVGLSILKLSYYTSLLFPMVAAQRLASRLSGLDQKAEYKVPMLSPPINNVLKEVMRVEGRILRHRDLPIGSSLIAICKG